MIKIPVSNYPNQSFVCTVPVNEQNINFRFRLWYNEQAQYWMLSIDDVKTEKNLISNIPVIASNYRFCNILYQMDYLKIGVCFVVPTNNDKKSMPNDKDLGIGYFLVWSDNNG